MVCHILRQMADACNLIETWNRDVLSVDDYLTTPEGMQKMAASCMLIESIGEGVKKIDRLMPEFLYTHASDMPWRSIKGLRDHIAHGYFNIDAEIVYDVSINEVKSLGSCFVRLLSVLEQ